MKTIFTSTIAIAIIATGCALPHSWDAQPAGTHQIDRSVFAQVDILEKNRYSVTLWLIGCDQTDTDVKSLTNIVVPDYENYISNPTNEEAAAKLDGAFDYLYSLPPITVDAGEWGSESMVTSNSTDLATRFVTVGGEQIEMTHSWGVVGKVRVLPRENGEVRLQGVVSSTWWGDGLFPFDGLLRSGERSMVYQAHSWLNPKNDKLAEQAGAGYPPQGVGSPDP